MAASINQQNDKDQAISACDNEVNGITDGDVKNVMKKMMMKVRVTETYKQRSTSTYEGWVQLLTADLSNAQNLPVPVASLARVASSNVMELVEQLKVLAKRNNMARFVYPWCFSLFTAKNQSNAVIMLNTLKCPDIQDRATKLGMNWSPHLDLLFRVSAACNKCFHPVTHMQLDLPLLARFGPSANQLKYGMQTLRDNHLRVTKQWIAAVKTMVNGRCYQQAKEL